MNVLQPKKSRRKQQKKRNHVSKTCTIKWNRIPQKSSEEFGKRSGNGFMSLCEDKWRVYGINSPKNIDDIFCHKWKIKQSPHFIFKTIDIIFTSQYKNNGTFNSMEIAVVKCL